MKMLAPKHWPTGPDGKPVKGPDSACSSDTDDRCDKCASESGRNDDQRYGNSPIRE